MVSLRDAARRASIVAAAATCVGLTAASAWQVVDLAGREIPYPGAKALSGPWSPPPEGDEADWLVSEGVEPPPASARPPELRAWLTEHYPVLTLQLDDRDVLSAERALKLGGGPPRVLFVEPGLGLVMRVPRD